MDIDVRLRMFTWFADVSGAVAVSRMGPDDISRARARRMSHNVVTSRVFGPMPRGVEQDLRVDDRSGLAVMGDSAGGVRAVEAQRDRTDVGVGDAVGDEHPARHRPEDP